MVLDRGKFSEVGGFRHTAKEDFLQFSKHTLIYHSIFFFLHAGIYIKIWFRFIKWSFNKVKSVSNSVKRGYSQSRPEKNKIVTLEEYHISLSIIHTCV